MNAVRLSGLIDAVRVVRRQATIPEPLPQPAVPVATRLWDGPRGASGAQFDAGMMVPWRNKGGDWVDSAGVAQGGAAYGRMAFSATASPPVARTLDIGALVAKRLGDPLVGVYLRGMRGVVQVATRRNLDAALHPALVLTWSDGSSDDCACVASASLNVSTTKPIVGAVCSVQSNAALALQFTLPDARGRSLQSAVLTLTATKVGELVWLDAYELNPVFIGSRAPVRADGISSRYVGDVGIERDPQMIARFDFEDARYGPPTPGKFSRYNDADLGLPAIEFTFSKGDFSPYAGQLMFSTEPLETGSDRYPSEVYAGTYVWFGDDFPCNTDGKKVPPSFDFRFGYLKTGSATPEFPRGRPYWQNVDGNGGAATKGRYITTVEDPRRADYGAPLAQPYWSGGSLRTIAAVSPMSDDPDHPHSSDIPVATYAYYADMPNVPLSGSQYGESWRWGSQEFGYPVLQTRRWYWIEMRLKMNSCVGPFDQYQNGTGVADGEFDVWIDGRQVFARRATRFVHNPLMARIAAFWFDYYHGGLLPAERTHTCRLARARVARSYIGPLQR